MIVREDLLGRAMPHAHRLRLQERSDNGSMYNTPPTYGIYIAGLVFQWLKRQGGVAAIEAQNVAKAEAAVRLRLDASDFYENRIGPACRSRMNVPFFLRTRRSTASSPESRKAAGLVQLKGTQVGRRHARVDLQTPPSRRRRPWCDFMRDFAARRG